MKQSWFYLSLLVGVFAGMLPVAQAADEASTTQTEKKAKKSKKSKKGKGEKAERPVSAMGEKLAPILPRLSPIPPPHIISSWSLPLGVFPARL